jgi:hypothetical protein
MSFLLALWSIAGSVACTPGLARACERYLNNDGPSGQGLSFAGENGVASGGSISHWK